MTGKIIDRGAAGFLVLIIPLAVGIVLLFTVWPFILLFILLGLVWKVWQDYRWSRLSAVVNPYFNQLLQEHQGCLTPMDLSVKANLTAKSALQFLERKADEFGAQKKTLGNKGIVYYFITASTLGSLFDESELPPEDEEIEVVSKSAVPVILASSQPAVTPPPLTGIGKLLEEVPEVPEEVPDSQAIETSQPAIGPLILSDLAKRLEITPAMLGKRKNSPEFADWSRSKDPEGIAWQYLPAESMFMAIED
jgi:hypothetical protein